MLDKTVWRKLSQKELARTSAVAIAPLISIMRFSKEPLLGLGAGEGSNLAVQARPILERKLQFMNKKENYVELPNSDVHNCFACSASNASGLKMKFFTDEKTVFSWLTVPEHLCGYNKVVHGGIVSTVLDEIMGWAALYLLEKITLTKTMTVAFDKAVYVGEPLMAEAKVIGRSGKREALLEAYIENEKGEICATSEGSFTLLSPKLAIRLGVMSAEGLKEFFEPLLKLRGVRT